MRLLSKYVNQTSVTGASWTTALLVALVTAGCSESKQQVGSTGNKISAEKEEAGEEYPDLEAEPEAAEDLETILKQCGVSAKDLEDPDAVILDKEIRSYPKVFMGAQAVPLLGNVNFRVSVATLVKLKATLREIEQETDFEIKGEPSQAEKPAWEKAAPNRGASKMTVMDTEERATLMGKSEDWSGVFCTVMPVKELSTTKGGTGKVVQFKPALPGSLSPKADASRYLKELSDLRVFNDIKAEIIGSQDPDYPEGKTLTGKVTIRKVDPTLTVNKAGASQDTIKADIAFKVEYDFGSVKDTVGLGLMPSQTMYISHKEKDIRVIVANTGFEDGGIVVLSEELNP
jgi:hypothetical protein